LQLSIIIPVYEDDQSLEKLLDDITRQGWDAEVLVIDGAATAATEALACQFGCLYVQSNRSRGLQVRCGIEKARWDMCLVLHADSLVNRAMLTELHALSRMAPVWGRFDIKIQGLGLIAWSMNVRSRLTKICTGDQAMFFHKGLVDEVGGFPNLPLMEDVEISKRLKASAGKSFVALHATVGTSPRRWRRNGVIRTVLSMWSYRLRYFMGVDSQDLYRRYYR